MLTGTQIYTAYSRFKRDVSDVSSATFIEWLDYMNKQLYEFIIGIDPERYISTENYTVSSDPQISALPSDFQTIDILGCGFYEIDSDGKDTQYNLAKTGHGRRDAGYYISGSNVVFTGISDSTIYKCRYIPTLTALTALGDSTILEDRYLQHAVADIDVLYSQWDVDPGSESLADFRFVRLLTELGNSISKDVNSYQIPDSSNNF